MKVVVYTQIRENYGAHDWDGEGQCPQYWKFKGGNTYVVHGVSVAQAQDAAWWDALYVAIEDRNDHFEEYIIAADPVDECDYDASKVCESWESPINLTLEYGEFVARRRTKADTYWGDPNVAAKVECWVQANGERQAYCMRYEMTNGSMMTYQEYCAQQKAA